MTRGMLFGSSIYYEVFKKNQMHFWIWRVVVCEAPPLLSLAHILVSYFFLFFAPRPFFTPWFVL